MADGFMIEITGAQAAEVEAAAKACGMSVEDYARAMLQLGLNSQTHRADLDVAEDIAAFEEYERTGMAIPHEEVIEWLRSVASGDPVPKPQPRKMK